MIIQEPVLAVPLFLAIVPLVFSGVNYCSERFTSKSLIKEWVFRTIISLALTALVFTPLALAVANFGSTRLLGKKLSEPELAGVTAAPPSPAVSFDALRSGQFQSDFEAYFTYNLPTRKSFTRLYNQFLYSLFHSTDQAGFLVGRDNYIYETAYADSYLTEVPTRVTPELAQRIAELAELNTLLKARGVALLVRISPTKAQHYPEYLPSGYARFVGMKQGGQYGPNWYEVFKKEIENTNIPFYDRYDSLQQMKQDGHIVFAKGGTHWTRYPLAEYINGMNSHLEKQLGRKLGRMTVASEEEKIGKMGTLADRDIWDICWNALSAEPDYLSPNIVFGTITSDFRPRVFTVGQSFTTVMLDAMYYNVESPVWSETLFSWYNSYVLRYPNSVNLPWGERIADVTNDYEKYLNADAIIIEFLESSATPTAPQFQFVNNMLNYLKSGKK